MFFRNRPGSFDQKAVAPFRQSLLPARYEGPHYDEYGPPHHDYGTMTYARAGGINREINRRQAADYGTAKRSDCSTAPLTYAGLRARHRAGTTLCWGVSENVSCEQEDDESQLLQ